MSSAANAEEKLDVAGIVALAAVTTIGLEQVRVYVSYLVWIVGETGSRPVLGALALAPFLAAGAAGIFLRWIGPRRGFLLTTVWLAAGSLAERSSAVPIVDLWLAGACVVFWGWGLVAAMVTVRRGTALALALGSAVDLALRLTFLTVDLPWTDHPLATVLAVGLAGCAMVGAQRAIARVAGTGEPGWRTLAPLLGLGPWLAATVLITGNPPQVMERTGAGFGLIAGALAIGQAVGVQLVSGMTARPPMGAGLSILGVTGIAAFIPLWNGWGGGPIWAAIAAASVAMLGAAVLRPAEAPAMRASAGATSLWLAGGLAGFVGLAYLYHTLYGPPLLIAAIVGCLVVAALAGAALTFARPGGVPVDTVWPARGVAAVLLAVGTVRAVSWFEPVATDAAPTELTVLTYNVRAGFGSDNRWDLERTARVIEAQTPDLVVLNEVTRGWVLASGTDEALWLSQRLGMPMLFGPAAGDLHGNAILTRYRADGRAYQYSSGVPSALPRGAIEARLETEGGTLLVLGTHLDYPEQAGPTRLAQLTELLTIAGARRPALVLGDMNAAADSPELAPIRAAEFVDLPAALGATQRTWPAHNPDRRIDHIFASPEIRPVSARVVETLASDHLPVVVRVRLP